MGIFKVLIMIQQFTTDELLPQRPPFVMIDKLTDYNEKITKTEFIVRKDNIFFKDGYLREPGIMENIAQTCAARLGYYNLINHRKVVIGYIGAIRNLIINSFPSFGDKLQTTIEVIDEVFGVTLVDAKVVCEDKLVAECSMKIAIVNNE
jgi:3-hydroxymyristoyl/3-hydroxydecanoyl-(acyl carrier protein) dehydratase